MNPLEIWFDKEKYIKKITVGNYIYGFDTVVLKMANPIKCCIAEDDLVFKAQNGIGQKIGRIPRNKISQINLENKMQASKRVTIPRLLFLGIFAFAAQKKEKIGGFELTISWDDNGKRDAVFEFTGMSANANANIALTTLRGFIKK